MSISFALFFFSSETLQRRFLPKKKLYTEGVVIVPKHRNLIIGIFSVYFLFQIGLPLRHWFIKDDVLWTEEGHRLSWRMMLRAKSGILKVYVSDKVDGVRELYDYDKLLGRKQRSAVRSKPDLMWQLAQRIKKVEAEKGRDVAVFMESSISVNNGPYHPFTDPNIDIAAEKWHPFKHSDWILPSPEDYHSVSESNKN